jgi:hypothetical protein
VFFLSKRTGIRELGSVDGTAFKKLKSYSPTAAKKRVNPNPHCFIAITKATACG